MFELVFASSNKNKIGEIRKTAERYGINIVSIDEAQIASNLKPFVAADETENSYVGNARLKARACFAWCKKPCFADDSGIEILSLNNKPGVDTANYASDKVQVERNLLLIEELRERSLRANDQNRDARFVSVQYFVGLENREWITEGELKGRISYAPKGDSGWGYEPIFIPEGFDKTIAELKDQGIFIKTHRILALERLFESLLSKRLI